MTKTKRELELEIRIQELEKKLLNRERELLERDRLLLLKSQENCGLRAFKGATEESMSYVLPFLSDVEQAIFHAVSENQFTDIEEFKRICNLIFRKTVSAMTQNRALLKHFGSVKSEKLTQKKDRTVINAMTEQVKQNLHKATTNVAAAVRLVRANSKILSQEVSDADLKEVCQTLYQAPHMFETKVDTKMAEFLDELANPDAMKYYGRQQSQCRLSANKVSAQSTSIRCPNCQSEMTLVAETLPLERLKTLHGDFSTALADFVEIQMHLWRCKKCHHVTVDVPQEAPVPVVPNQSLSQDVIINGLYFFHNGMPLNRFSELFLKPMALGQSTFAEIRSDFSRFYEEGLWKAITAQMDAKILLVDETTYPCLETQGCGASVKIDDCDKNKSQKNYVMVYANPTWQERRLRGYRYIGRRSAEAITEGLNGLTPEVLVTDAYGAYNKVLKDTLTEAKHQCCIVHFRRSILECLNFEMLKREAKRLNDEELETMLRAHLGKKTQSQLYLLMIIEALSKIFSYERYLSERRAEGEDESQYLARVKIMRDEHSRPLMDGIDRLMQEVIKENEGYARSPYDKVISYYLNQKEAMRYFLEDPRVPIHTNAVEQAVRMLVIARQASKFAQTEKGMKEICLSASLIETAQCNGIENPVEWLCDYGRALFKYCYERQWQLEYEANPIEKKNPEKRFQKWDMLTLAQGFDYEPWLPWNWITKNK